MKRTTDCKVKIDFVNGHKLIDNKNRVVKELSERELVKLLVKGVDHYPYK